MREPREPRKVVAMQLHPQEAALIRYLRALRFGRLERLEVQDGLPVAAEEVRGKVRFDRKAAGERLR